MPTKTERPSSCIGCGDCADSMRCEPYRAGKELRSYNGLRITADGFDCALPVAFDTYSACSFGCLYCFSNFLMRDPNRQEAYLLKAQAGNVGADRLRVLERVLAGEDGKVNGIAFSTFREALNLDHKLRCPLQWGALGDPFDNIERNQRRGLDFIRIVKQHRQPVRVSSKGRLMTEKPWIDELDPELFWFAWSLITPDDGLLQAVDRWAPNATQRLKAMKTMSKLGYRTSLRFRPAIPGMSDSTPKHPHAYKELIDRAAEAGARAISFEVIFMPGSQSVHIKKLLWQLEERIGHKLVAHYRRTSLAGACLRSSRQWVQDFTLAVVEHARKCGLAIGISDPHFKELNDSVCCCGIAQNDPIFGGFQRHCATGALLKAKKTGKEVGIEDFLPAWASQVKLDSCVCIAGAKNMWKRLHLTWGDKLRETWNDLQSPRGPLHYFDGVLRPSSRDDAGNIRYKFYPWQRKEVKPFLWKL